MEEKPAVTELNLATRPNSNSNLSSGHGDHASTEKATGLSALGLLDHSDDSLLDSTLFPRDIYVGRTYWADLPFSERVKFVNAQSNAEAEREVKEVHRMFKADPLEPTRQYFHCYVLTGMGLFVEGYTLFAIGNVKALFQAVWPACWKTHEVCNANWIAAVDYLQIIGIMLGQVAVGIEGDWIGRRFGMVQDALVMFLGTIMLIAMWGTTLNGWVICYAFSLLVYGFGVGGEYPMTSTRAMESTGASAEASAHDRLHRGRNVGLSFLMQGWGQLANQVVLIVLLLIFHGGGNPPYSATSTQWTMRIQFAFIAVPTLYLAYYRYYKIRYADAALVKARKRLHTSGYDSASLKMTISHYGGRLFGTAMAWFANDFFFYGNKIFASEFIGIISPGSKSVITTWLWNLVNIGVSLAGYYMAAFLIDHKFVGRRRMQSMGFLMDFVLFLIPAAIYDHLLKPGVPIHGFQAMFFLSSFFQQFGPNSTTFLLAAEVYPSTIRSTAHGFSAAMGKLGALAPAILYNYIDNHTKFWVVSWFGLAGWLITEIFVPDTTGLDLREQERYWEFVRAGRGNEYHGVAIHPRHLSLWEHLVLKRSRNYNPELDHTQRIEALHDLYKASHDPNRDEQHDVEDESFVSEDIKKYFAARHRMMKSRDLVHC